MNKILITGATGFVGKNLVNRLRQSPQLDIYATEHNSQMVFGVKPISSDVKILGDLVTKIQPDICFNLASVYERNPVNVNLSEYFAANLVLPLTIMQSMKKDSVFINVNSYFSLDQFWRQNPTFQGATKLAFSPYLHYFQNEFMIKTYDIYLTDVFGHSDTRDKVLPTIKSQFLKGQIDLKLSNPQAVIYPTLVSNVVDVLCQMAFEIESFPDNQFILSSGKGYKVQDIISVVEELLKLNSIKCHTVSQSLQVAEVILETELIKKVSYDFEEFQTSLYSYLLN